ncbi:MAG: HAMP domain-containing sensor histidine kinase [Peptostreptococcales bacterium]
MRKLIFLSFSAYILIAIIISGYIIHINIGVAQIEDEAFHLKEMSKLFDDAYYSGIPEEETVLLLNNVAMNTLGFPVIIREDNSLITGNILIEINDTKLVLNYAEWDQLSRSIISNYGQEGDQVIDILKREGNSYFTFSSNDKDKAIISNYILSNGDALIIVKSMRISNIVNILRRNLLVMAILVALVSSIATYIGAKVVTKSIDKVRIKAEKIKNRDFDLGYRIKGPKEIVILDETITRMAKETEFYTELLANNNMLLTEQIEKVEREKEKEKQFISDVSHELKTPIAVIKSHAEALIDGIGDRNYYQKAIYDESMIMEDMVTRLLEMIKADGAYIESHAEWINLSEMIKEHYHKFHSLLNQYNKTLDYKIEEDITLFIERFRLEFIINNLITNAIKYSTAPGVIIEAKGDEQYVIITTYNKSEPFTDEELEDIWRKFYRKDEARNRSTSSTGLGLSVVANIVEEYKGDYNAQYLDGGLLITIKLPLSRGKPE